MLTLLLAEGVPAGSAASGGLLCPSTNRPFMLLAGTVVFTTLNGNDVSKTTEGNAPAGNTACSGCAVLVPHRIPPQGPTLGLPNCFPGFDFIFCKINGAVWHGHAAEHATATPCASSTAFWAPAWRRRHPHQVWPVG